MRYTKLAGTNNKENTMLLNELIESFTKNDLAPRDYNLVSEQASWVFSSLKAQYSFVILLDNLLSGSGYILSDPPDTDGEVQRIDYLYLKQYEGFEIFVHWDFKVELNVFKY